MQLMGASALVSWVRREADSAAQMAEAMEIVEPADREGRDGRLRYAADLYDEIGMRRAAEWCRSKLAEVA